MAINLDNLGMLYTEAGRMADAERAFEEAIQTAEKYPAVARPHLPGILSDYAGALRKMKRNLEAKTVTARAQALTREMAFEDPSRQGAL